MSATAARRWPVVTAASLAAVLVLVLVLLAGGGAPQEAPAGLPDPGALTGWGVPVTRLLADLAVVLLTGCLLAAGMLLPTDAGQLRGSGLRLTRVAALAAVVVAVTAPVQLVLTFSDFLALPVGQVLDPGGLASFITQTVQGRGLFVQTLAAAVVATVAPWVLSARAAAFLLVPAMVALVAPMFAGHSSASDDHVLAVSSLIVHVLAVSLWVGGLMALTMVALRSVGPLATAVPRFSALALWCVVAVGVSGLVNALVRFDRLADLVTTSYGLLVLAKVLALVVLAGFGYVHRQRTIPALSGARPGWAFARIAAAEVVVMAGTLGLAVGLSRTPTPAGAASGAGADRAREILGYPMPPPPTLERLLFDVRPAGLLLALVALGVALYLTGVRVLSRRGDRWPPGRTAAWLGGLAVLVAVTSTGVGRYAPVLFSVHMVQHMTLNMVVPVLLVLGAPITLALRTLPGGRAHGGHGPRDTLLAVLNSRPARLLTNPLVAAAIFVGSLYGLYFGPWFGDLMTNHWGHLAMQLHFVLAGFLFFWVLIGTDPGPHRPPYLLRVLLLFVTMAFHAFFSIALMSMTTVLAGDYYRGLDRPWGGTLLQDQELGGGIGWAFGEVPIVLVLVALFVQWARADEREARASDRAADRAAARSETDELAAYNSHLAELSRRTGDRRQGDAQDR